MASIKFQHGNTMQEFANIVNQMRELPHLSPMKITPCTLGHWHMMSKGDCCRNAERLAEQVEDHASSHCVVMIWARFSIRFHHQQLHVMPQ